MRRKINKGMNKQRDKPTKEEMKIGTTKRRDDEMNRKEQQGKNDQAKAQAIE